MILMHTLQHIITVIGTAIRQYECQSINAGIGRNCNLEHVTVAAVTPLHVVTLTSNSSINGSNVVTTYYIYISILIVTMQLINGTWTMRIIYVRNMYVSLVIIRHKCR